MTLDAPKINETLDGKFGKGRGLLMLLLPPPRFPCLATAHTLTFLRAADQRQQRCERWAVRRRVAMGGAHLEWSWHKATRWRRTLPLPADFDPER